MPLSEIDIPQTENIFGVTEHDFVVFSVAASHLESPE
jgi:hypothetical protein